MKKILGLVIASVIIMSQINFVLAARFTDVQENHWAYTWVEQVANMGIVNGYTDGTFKPSNKVTNGEFLKMMTMVVFPSYTPYQPEAGEHWAQQYTFVVEQLIGYKLDETKKLSDEVTREQMAEMLAMLSLKFNSKNVIDETNLNVEKFSDKQLISDAYIKYVDYCVKYKLLNGFEDGTFKPQDSLTRAQAAKVLTMAANK